jgi:hypothetical protein
MVSQGGAEPRWRRDGKELFYLSPDGQLMASEVTANGAAFQASIPKPLFKAQLNVAWDVSPDGSNPVPRHRRRHHPVSVHNGAETGWRC